MGQRWLGKASIAITRDRGHWGDPKVRIVRPEPSERKMVAWRQERRTRRTEAGAVRITRVVDGKRKRRIIRNIQIDLTDGKPCNIDEIEKHRSHSARLREGAHEERVV
jgi:hypothetical protein